MIFLDVGRGLTEILLMPTVCRSAQCLPAIFCNYLIKPIKLYIEIAFTVKPL